MMQLTKIGQAQDLFMCQTDRTKTHYFYFIIIIIYNKSNYKKLDERKMKKERGYNCLSN